MNVVIHYVKGFLLGLSKLVHRQPLPLLKPTQTLVMNEPWNTLENYRIYNAQTRKKVTFPFICNQPRWPAKTLPSKHNPKRRFLCAKNPVGGGRWPQAQKATCWDLVVISFWASCTANKAWGCFTRQRNELQPGLRHGSGCGGPQREDCPCEPGLKHRSGGGQPQLEDCPCDSSGAKSKISK